MLRSSPPEAPETRFVGTGCLRPGAPLVRFSRELASSPSAAARFEAQPTKGPPLPFSYFFLNRVQAAVLAAAASRGTSH